MGFIVALVVVGPLATAFATCTDSIVTFCTFRAIVVTENVAVYTCGAHTARARHGTQHSILLYLPLGKITVLHRPQAHITEAALPEVHTRTRCVELRT